MSGFSISFSSTSEYSLFNNDRAIQLNANMVPTVVVQNVRRTFLNVPFTLCVDPDQIRCIRFFIQIRISTSIFSTERSLSQASIQACLR